LVEGVTLQDYVLELPPPEMSHRFSALLGVSCVHWVFLWLGWRLRCTGSLVGL